MAVKLVKHKLREDWGIGELENKPLISDGKVAIKWPEAKDINGNKKEVYSYTYVRNLEIVGFYD